MDIGVQVRVRNETNDTNTLLLVASNGLGTEFAWLDVSVTNSY